MRSDVLTLSRYLLRVTVTRGYGASTEKDFFFWVRNYAPPPPPSNHPPIKVRAAAVPRQPSVPKLTLHHLGACEKAARDLTWH